MPRSIPVANASPSRTAAAGPPVSRASARTVAQSGEPGAGESGAVGDRRPACRREDSAPGGDGAQVAGGPAVAQRRAGRGVAHPVAELSAVAVGVQEYLAAVEDLVAGAGADGQQTERLGLGGGAAPGRRGEIVHDGDGDAEALGEQSGQER